jgi:hypothetical protein
MPRTTSAHLSPFVVSTDACWRRTPRQRSQKTFRLAGQCSNEQHCHRQQSHYYRISYSSDEQNEQKLSVVLPSLVYLIGSFCSNLRQDGISSRIPHKDPYCPSRSSIDYSSSTQHHAVLVLCYYSDYRYYSRNFPKKNTATSPHA